MTDNEILRLLGNRLKVVLAANFAEMELALVAKQQPRQNGIPVNGGVFVEHLFDSHIGWAQQKSIYDPETNVFREVESQWTTAHMQVSAIVPQDPLFPNRPTASDVATMLRASINHRATVREFMRVGVGISRISDVRNPYFENDRDQAEGFPSFDVELHHLRTASFDIPAIKEVIPAGDPYPTAPGAGVFRID